MKLSRSVIGRACVLALGCSAAALLAAAPARAAGDEMTQERLLNADKEQGNWITHHKDYSAHRFSTLDQINRETVKNLKVAFTDPARRCGRRRHLGAWRA